MQYSGASHWPRVPLRQTVELGFNVLGGHVMEKTPWQYPPLSQGPVGGEHIALLPTGQATPAGDADCGCPVVATGHPTSAGQVGNDPEQFSAGSQADLLGRQTVPAGSSLLVGHFADSPLQNPPASHSPCGCRH